MTTVSAPAQYDLSKRSVPRQSEAVNHLTAVDVSILTINLRLCYNGNSSQRGRVPEAGL